MDITNLSYTELKPDETAISGSTYTLITMSGRALGTSSAVTASIRMTAGETPSGEFVSRGIGKIWAIAHDPIDATTLVNVDGVALGEITNRETIIESNDIGGLSISQGQITVTGITLPAP